MTSMPPTRGVLTTMRSVSRASNRFFANSICSGVMPGRGLNSGFGGGGSVDGAGPSKRGGRPS